MLNILLQLFFFRSQSQHLCFPCASHFHEGMFRILNFYFFFFFLMTSSSVQMHWFCWANAVFMDLSLFSCLCFTPFQLCNVASWTVVQSDVQSSKFFLKMPSVTYKSMRIHYLLLCSSSVELCRIFLMLTMLYPLYPDK